MSYSLLFVKKNKKQRVESVLRRDTVSRAPSASAIRDGVKNGQMRFIHSSPPAQPAKQFCVGPPEV